MADPVNGKRLAQLRRWATSRFRRLNPIDALLQSVFPWACTLILWPIATAVTGLTVTQQLLFSMGVLMLAAWWSASRSAPRTAPDWLNALADDAMLIARKTDAIEWRGCVFAALYGANYAYLLEDWHHISSGIDSATTDAESIRFARQSAFWLRTRAANQRILDPISASQIQSGNHIRSIGEQVKALLDVRPSTPSRESAVAWTVNAMRLIAIAGTLPRANEFSRLVAPLDDQTRSLGPEEITKILDDATTFLRTSLVNR